CLEIYAKSTKELRDGSTESLANKAGAKGACLTTKLKVRADGMGA
ncbi:unnamed protein product, partial [Didymodactylos carnosus]